MFTPTAREVCEVIRFNLALLDSGHYSLGCRVFKLFEDKKLVLWDDDERLKLKQLSLRHDYMVTLLPSDARLCGLSDVEPDAFWREYRSAHVPRVTVANLRSYVVDGDARRGLPGAEKALAVTAFTYAAVLAHNDGDRFAAATQCVRVLKAGGFSTWLAEENTRMHEPCYDHIYATRLDFRTVYRYASDVIDLPKDDYFDPAYGPIVAPDFEEEEEDDSEGEFGFECETMNGEQNEEKKDGEKNDEENDGGVKGKRENFYVTRPSEDDW